MNTETVNPYFKKTGWICAKLKRGGRRTLLPEESLFIAELARRAYVQDDRTALRLLTQIQAAHLEFHLSLPARHHDTYR